MKTKLPTQKTLASTIDVIQRGLDDFGDWYEQGEVAGLWYHTVRIDGRYYTTVYVEGNDAAVCDRAGKANSIAAAAQDALEYCEEFGVAVDVYS